MSTERREPKESENIESCLRDPSLTDGQRRRLRLFQQVEPAVVKRIEGLCESGEIEVPDVGVLVIAPMAHGLVFDGSYDPCVNVLVGPRTEIHQFLQAALPPAQDGTDPYADLLEPAPPRCVRVLILDDESLTVMSYGCFLTVRMDPRFVAQA
jgi:hypothetical protein